MTRGFVMLLTLTHLAWRCQRCVQRLIVFMRSTGLILFCLKCLNCYFVSNVRICSNFNPSFMQCSGMLYLT
uniref:Uncharacterized protein n=1 Tax=Pararge aegeria TaxID=116150 RepID=S4P1I6_9NEOP